MRKIIAVLTALTLFLGVCPVLSFAAPNSATVNVDGSAAQGELFRMEKYNNLSGVNTYSTKADQDIPFMIESGLNTKIIRVWVSEGFYDLSSNQLNPAEIDKYKAYLTWASQLSDTILINITGGSYLKNNASEADIKNSLKPLLKWFKDNFPKVVYIECLNEPDNVASIKNSPHDYYRYYKNFYTVVNELNAENNYEMPLKVGGPAIMSYRYEPGKTWIPTFIKDYADDRDPNKKLDFISYHVYSYPDNPSMIKDIRPEVEGYFRDAGLPTDIPSFVTESGLYPGSREDLSIGEDQMTMAAGMLSYAYYWMENENDVPFQWVMRHSSQERKDQLVTRPDYPTQKLTMYGNVMSMMSKMKTTRISAVSDSESNGFGVNAIAASDNTGVSVVSWNYQRKNSDTYEANININNLPSIFNGKNIKVKKYVVDYGNGNFYFNRNDPNLKVQSEVVYPNASSFSSTVHMAPNANIMLILEPTDESVTANGSPISIYLNEIQYRGDVDPVEVSGRTLVPIRLISEALGCNVAWDESTQTATITKGTKTVKLTINNTSAVVNNSNVALDVPAQLINDRTMVPIRFISENLDCSVEWAGGSKSVLMTSAQAPTYKDLCGDNSPAKDGPLSSVMGRYTPISAVASATDGDHAAANAIDYNSNKTYWNSGNAEAGASLTLDFGKEVKIDGVFAAFTNGKDSISTFDVAVSNDGANWTTVASNVQSSGKTLDTQTFPLAEAVNARYVAYIGKGNTLDKENSLLGFGAYGVDGTLYEAENATSKNSVTVATAKDYPSSGGKFTDYGDAGSYIEFNNVTAESDGQYTMSVVYAIGSKTNRDCKITVNGQDAGTLVCPGTNTWENWQTASITLNLKAGANTVRITANGSGPNIDYFMISK